MSKREGLRLALGTLSVVPSGQVRTDRATAGSAMLSAPLIGMGLGAAAGTIAWGAFESHTPGLAAAALALAVLALGTRGLHLDGLADTADGLGCGGPPERALAVLKDPHIGAFGVITLLLTLLIQASTLVGQLGHGRDSRVIAALVIAAAAGRANLSWACRTGVPPARPDGLGAVVAASVDPLSALGCLAVVTAAAGALGAMTDLGLARSAGAVLLSWVSAELLLRRCVAAFGGITGDVLGAIVEVGTAVALVVLSTAPAYYDSGFTIRFG